MSVFTFAIVDRVSTFDAVQIVVFVDSRKKMLQLMPVWMSVSGSNLGLHDIPNVVQLRGRWEVFGVVRLKAKVQKAGDL
jgi:hypothetical protein